MTSILVSNRRSEATGHLSKTKSCPYDWFHGIDELVSTALVLQPLRQETRSIPIVFTQIGEPVQSGVVASLAHPGGNITGFAAFEASVWGKSLEVLKEVAPHVARVAVILNPDQAPQAGMWRAVEAAAPSLAVKATATPVRNAVEIERAIDAFAREPNGGLIVLPSGPTIVHRELIIALAARHRLPAIYPYRPFVAAGGLICYGLDLAEQYRGAAAYVDRILRGEKPADLPVQQPTKFELVINLTTAKALGLKIPSPSCCAPTRLSSDELRPPSLLHCMSSAFGTKRRKPRRRVYVGFWESSGSAWADGLGCLRRK